jgi:glutathione S-transferase
MKLYLAPGTCSLAVHITLRELGESFDAVTVDLATHKTQRGEDYYEISPRGYVPLLELNDGTRHTEVASLLQYLADSHLQGRLIGPTGTARRLAVTEWLGFVATELHKIFMWLWYKDTADSTRKTVHEKLNVRFKELDAHLARNDWLAGDYSVADAYAFAILNWTNLLSISLGSYPNLQAYMQRMGERPAVRDAMQHEGLVK